MARMLAQHCELEAWDATGAWSCSVPETHRHLLEKPYQDKLQAALEEHFGPMLRAVQFSARQPATARRRQSCGRARQPGEAGAAIAGDRGDPFVRELVENFDARVVNDSHSTPVVSGRFRDRRKQA